MDNNLPPSLPSNPVSSNPSTPIYAGFVIRTAALFLDSLFVSMPITLVGSLIFGLNSNILIGLLPAALFAFLLSRYGATPGKMIFHLKVVSREGSNPTFLIALLREIVGKFLSSIVFSLGYLWVIFDHEKQAWHDKIAKTHVVSTQPLTGFKKFLMYAIFSLIFILPIIAILAVLVILVINPAAQIQKAKGL